MRVFFDLTGGSSDVPSYWLGFIRMAEPLRLEFAAALYHVASIKGMMSIGALFGPHDMGVSRAMTLSTLLNIVILSKK